MVTFKGAVLGVRTTGGAFATKVRLKGQTRELYSQGEYETLGISLEKSNGRDALVIQVVERDLVFDDGAGTPGDSPQHEDMFHLGTICELDATVVECRTTLTRLASGRKDAVNPSPVRTTSTGELVIDVVNAKR